MEKEREREEKESANKSGNARENEAVIIKNGLNANNNNKVGETLLERHSFLNHTILACFCRDKFVFFMDNIV